MNNALEVRGLKKKYDTFSLKDVSFKIPKGYIMGFIGPNGAGKTTTIKSILNMINYQADEIKLFGFSSKEHAEQLNDQIGVVMDSPFYVEDWTTGDVEKAVSPFYKNWSSSKYSELLSVFRIDKKKKVKELSRGMKVKLMVAVALSHDAKLLILDEPTSGLDPVARDELCDMLSNFVTDENRSILFSTHITSDLEKIADYITFILDGQIIYTGSKENLLEKYILVKGGLREISAEQKKLIIGLREHNTGFEGMTETSNMNKLPKTLLFEPITLDEIIIYMNKGAKLYE
ncbi:MAG: ABC-type multidrug transport system, ATPase component [Herbinix sp.]|jgi:ABC-2 type transport system ATP-binding protein|nr:ABC-type multidrug transport system, ATPase component [Herbinix sp.]